MKQDEGTSKKGIWHLGNGIHHKRLAQVGPRRGAVQQSREQQVHLRSRSGQDVSKENLELINYLDEFDYFERVPRFYQE